MFERRILFLALAITVACWRGASSLASDGPARPPQAISADWHLQDGLLQGRSYQQAVNTVVQELATTSTSLRAELAALQAAGAGPQDRRWEAAYLRACEERRAVRLRTLIKRTPRIVFTKHYDLGGSHYAYTEGQSDAQAERHFEPGASLCLLTMRGLYGEPRTLLDDRKGVIRDPDVSYDARRVLFAWKK